MHNSYISYEFFSGIHLICKSTSWDSQQTYKTILCFKPCFSTSAFFSFKLFSRCHCFDRTSSRKWRAIIWCSTRHLIVNCHAWDYPGYIDIKHFENKHNNNWCLERSLALYIFKTFGEMNVLSIKMFALLLRFLILLALTNFLWYKITK